jgi:hypothetical protein
MRPSQESYGGAMARTQPICDQDSWSAFLEASERANRLLADTLGAWLEEPPIVSALRERDRAEKAIMQASGWKGAIACARLLVQRLEEDGNEVDLPLARHIVDDLQRLASTAAPKQACDGTTRGGSLLHAGIE